MTGIGFSGQRAEFLNCKLRLVVRLRRTLYKLVFGSLDLRTEKQRSISRFFVVRGITFSDQCQAVDGQLNVSVIKKR